MSLTKGPNLCYVRGDTQPLTLIFKRAAVAVDLSGFTGFVLTTNLDQDPTDVTNEQFKMAGTFTTDGTDGSIDFEPIGLGLNGEAEKRTASELYDVDAEMFYDVQADDGTGRRSTLVYEGKFDVLQDINKD